MEFVAQKLPVAKLAMQSAGDMVYTLPYSHLDDISQFFCVIEQGVPFITDWSVSHTTMEEVFLRITHGSDDGSVDNLQPAEQVSLFVAVEGVEEPIGHILVSQSTTLYDARALIVQLDGVPASYTFLYNGVNVGIMQEASKFAASFVPLLVIHASNNNSASGTNVSTTLVVWEKERETLLEENKYLKRKVEVLEKNNQELQKKLEELDGRL